MSKIKLFEEYYSEEEQTPSGFISVPPDFDDRLKGLEEFTKRHSKFYDVRINQIKVDLYYGIKFEIKYFLDTNNYDNKTQEKYEEFLNSNIYHNGSGILAKYSGVKYYNIDKSDVEEVKTILWKHINEKLPFNEVDYYYTYDLQGKLLNLLDDFLAEIQEKGLWKDSDKDSQ